MGRVKAMNVVQSEKGLLEIFECTADKTDKFDGTFIVMISPMDGPKARPDGKIVMFGYRAPSPDKI